VTANGVPHLHPSAHKTRAGGPARAAPQAVSRDQRVSAEDEVGLFAGRTRA